MHNNNNNINLVVNKLILTDFINDIKCCGGLFSDNIVLSLLRVHKWANLNEMTFGIEKCETMVIKLVNFQSPPNYNDPTFYLGMNSIMNSILKVFNDLLLEHIISHIHFKVRKSLPSFIYIKAIYYFSLLGSNKSRTARIQTLINYWSILEDLEILNVLHFDRGEQRQLNELLFQRTLKLVQYLSYVVPSTSLLIRYNDNTGSSSISMKGSINDESPGESLVNTTLSILKDLLL
ncbi:hypothetical protein H8356DRAFT_1341462 [Neocallimastix lanati (nom. inval.)]|nr:hypothetical protein H8356DRAFT_1341462 [Neocallimastix sp. JGI-2020a]